MKSEYEKLVDTIHDYYAARIMRERLQVYRLVKYAEYLIQEGYNGNGRN